MSLSKAKGSNKLTCPQARNYSYTTRCSGASQRVAASGPSSLCEQQTMGNLTYIGYYY